MLRATFRPHAFSGITRQSVPIHRTFSIFRPNVLQNLRTSKSPILSFVAKGTRTYMQDAPLVQTRPTISWQRMAMTAVSVPTRLCAHTYNDLGWRCWCSCCHWRNAEPGNTRSVVSGRTISASWHFQIYWWRTGTHCVG